MEHLLEIKNLSIEFVTDNGATKAVNDVSFSVTKGEIVAVVGESGSGKSVTALSLLKLLPSKITKYPTGQMLYRKEDGAVVDLLGVSSKDIMRIRGNDIAMIFQEPMTSLNPVYTCGDQVVEAMLLHQRIGRKEAKQKALALFEKVKLPNPQRIFKSYPHQVSGGQKQRVMIAMAMSCEPDLLIADEPTTALDVTVQNTILQLIKELQAQNNMGVIFITHDLGVVAEIADRVVVMYRGLIVEQGTVQEIFESPQHPYTKGLLACRPVLHEKGERLPVVSDFLETAGSSQLTVESTEHTTTTEANNSPLTTHHSQLQTPNSKLQTQNAETILKVENLKVWFPSVKTLLGKTLEYTKAVDDVSFEVFKGETLGLVGESGCGKTTLGRALLRLVSPTSGKIIFDGRDMLSLSHEALLEMREDIQIVFQDPYSSLNPRITIGDAISEPLMVHHKANNKKQARDAAIGLLEKVSLKAEHFKRYPHEFSGGQRQRIVIARALALNPSFIVCDESVSALDVSVQAQVLNLLNDLKKEFDFTVIFISHDLGVVKYISDRIMVMNKGKIEEIGAAEEVYHHPKSAYTQQLINAVPKGIVR